MRSLAAIALLLVTSQLADAGEAFRPDPAAVRRHGPGYRYPQDGWVVVHVEGQPYERGYQHGTLLAPEIGDYVKNLATQQSKADPSNAYQAPQAISCRDFATRKPLPVAPAGPNAPDRREREVGAQAGSALWLLSDPMGYRVLGPDGAPLAR